MLKCPVCEQFFGHVRFAVDGVQSAPLPGDIGVCLRCRMPLYFGPEGWRELEQQEISTMPRQQRVILDFIASNARVKA